MTNFFTKLASAFTLLALVASFVPAAVFAQEAPAEVVEAAPEVISDAVIETPVVVEEAPAEEAPVQESEEITNQDTAPVVEEETGIVEQVINSVVSLFAADEISLQNLTAPEAANVTIDRAVAIDNTASWTTDRHEPENWGNNGTVFVDGTLDSQQSGDTFYRTEGRKTSLNNVSSVEASLYIDPAWENTAARAGLWATGNGAVGEWGIIDYTSAAGYVAGDSATFTKDPVFRVWDSRGNGSWTPVMEAVPGQTYVLRVEVADGNWNYYINGDLISQIPLDGTAGTTAIKEVILNQYNYGAEATPVDGAFGNRPYTVHWTDMGVTNSFDALSAAVAAANAGDTIVLNDNVTETATVNVDKKVTIVGNGHTVTAGSGVTGSVVLVTANDVTIKDLTVDAAHLPVQGIQAYVASNVTLDGVTAKNANKSGIMVNGSTVTANNVTTSGNNWHGINVDQGSGVTSEATLTVTGTSSHSDIGPAIFVDSTAKGSVVAGAQYTVVDQAPAAKAYYLNTVKNEAELNAALAAHISAITLGDSFSVSSQVTVDHAVTINGNGKTITASGNLSGSVVLITGANVSINDLTVVGKAGVHGIQAYATTGVSLTDVTVKNSGKSGLLVNGSTVTVTNLTTSGNGWNGVNVDRGVNVVTAAALTVNGVSKHDENDAIWVDDITKADVSVIDTNAQYVSSDRVSGAVTGRVYTLRPEERSRGRSGGSSRSTTTNTGTTGAVDGGGQVLGASTYNFSANLTTGATGADVNALQQMLIDAGLLKIAAPTGFFGPMTTEALKAWQAAHGVPATGFFGPLTMAAIAAANPAPTMTDEARAALIKDILEKVKELQEKLDAMQKDAA